jgi:putative hemolysin
MLNNIFSFYKKTAKDIMVHRIDATSLYIDDTIDVAVNLAKSSGYTRFPVVDANREGIVGFIHAKDLLRRSSTAKLADIVRPPLYVYETMHLDRLLHLMQEKRQQFCVVVDEYGAWQGIITMEDVVEVVVGDIQDEFDNEEPEFVPQPDGSVIISAALSLDDLAGRMDISCMESDINMYAIIATHIIERLGRIPVVGDQVSLCGKVFTVTGMDRHRVRRVRVEGASEHGADGLASAPAVAP